MNAASGLEAVTFAVRTDRDGALHQRQGIGWWPGIVRSQLWFL